jgi:hypothetical protein
MDFRPNKNEKRPSDQPTCETTKNHMAAEQRSRLPSHVLVHENNSDVATPYRLPVSSRVQLLSK